MQADNSRLAALAGYSVTRNYRFDNQKFKKHAEMTVRMSAAPMAPKRSRFSPKAIRVRPDHIIRKMMEAEEESSRKGEHKETRIIPDNYDFRLVGTEVSDGRQSYILEIIRRNRPSFPFAAGSGLMPKTLPSRGLRAGLRRTRRSGFVAWMWSSDTAVPDSFGCRP